MATKRCVRKPKPRKSAVGSLPAIAPVQLGRPYATSRAVTRSEALALIARGWKLTQNDDRAIVVACTADVLAEED